MRDEGREAEIDHTIEQTVLSVSGFIGVAVLFLALTLALQGATALLVFKVVDGISRSARANEIGLIVTYGLIFTVVPLAVAWFIGKQRSARAARFACPLSAGLELVFAGRVIFARGADDLVWAMGGCVVYCLVSFFGGDLGDRARKKREREAMKAEADAAAEAAELAHE